MEPLPEKQAKRSPADDVRCLECGTVYSKPIGGGTVRANPGCPTCGYVGWLAVSIPLSAESSRPRSGEDRRQQRPA